MKLRVAAFLLIAFFATLLYLPAGADNQDGVEILVTPKIISITVDQDELDYGSPAVGTVGNVPSPLGFNVKNEGTAAVKLQIRGDDTTSADGSWTLATTAGPETYVHHYAVGWDTPSFPSNFAPLKKFAEDFPPNLAPGGSLNIKLALDMPTSTTKLSQHTAPVIIIATDASQ